MAYATFFKRFMELKIKLIRRVARLVFQSLTVAMLVLLISPDCNAFRGVFFYLPVSMVYGLLSFIIHWGLHAGQDQCAGFLCKYTLYSHVASLYWQFKLVHAFGGEVLLHKAKCFGLPVIDHHHVLRAGAGGGVETVHLIISCLLEAYCRLIWHEPYYQQHKLDNITLHLLIFIVVRKFLITINYFCQDEDNELEETGLECVICMSDMRDTLILPCRHLCLCRECGELGVPIDVQIEWCISDALAQYVVFLS